jgi:hypothetical protein
MFDDVEQLKILAIYLRSILFLSKVCCGNESIINVSGNGRFSVCCGTTVYDYRNEICCNGILTSRSDGYSTACCGNQTYNSATHECCMGSEFNWQQGSDMQVSEWDATPYDPATQFCCDGKVLSRLYGRYSTWCCGGSTVYDTSISVCCNGTIASSLYGDYSVCCGATVVNDLTTGCCANPDGTNAQPFTRQDQTCCNGVVEVRRQQYV